MKSAQSLSINQTVSVETAHHVTPPWVAVWHLFFGMWRGRQMEACSALNVLSEALSIEGSVKPVSTPYFQTWEESFP